MGNKRYTVGQKYTRLQYILRVPHRRWIGGKPKGSIMVEKIPPIASAYPISRGYRVGQNVALRTGKRTNSAGEATQVNGSVTQ